MTHQVLGVDPGPTAGVALLELGGPPLVFQCNAAAAWGLAAWLASGSRGGVSGAVEEFQAGRGAGARGAGAAVTRALIGELTGGQGVLGTMTWRRRAAGLVKPWATDRRLAAAGLLSYCAGMPHAADACRQALYAAVHDCGWPDPLSRDWGAA